ncbi:hypothetical protein [Streptomyces indicus]|uniref:Acetolactate synthase-1/2/3 large subunit n=1 Tax=Streptomyces indicus TaxID=417292 RepID=A0A1G8UCS8_9ACTN|nr:hypothetical protein [Streptomyces indicus]SDJ51579.1 acetolactate synthase-1/2/3 large subunit [Streptomyces indicus]
MPDGLIAPPVTDGRHLARELGGDAAQVAFALGLAHFEALAAHGRAASTALDATAIESLAHLLAHAEQPVAVLGSGVWAARATDAAVELIRTLGMPAYADGAGRGTLPPGDTHHFLHSRAYAFAGADVILVVGSPFGVRDSGLRDFRAGYGRRISPHATVVQLDAGGTGRVLRAVAQCAAGHAVGVRADQAATRRKAWLDEVRAAERTAESLWTKQLTSDASPVHPFRLLAEIDRFLTEDSVFIADDPWSAELAGRVVRPWTPGHWMDPGPLGTAGVGFPFALAVGASGAHRESVVLFRDDPLSTAAGGFASLVRHHLPFIGVVAHTGAAPFVNRARAHGGYGEDVRDPAALRPALERARAAGIPALIGVRTDQDAYLPGAVNQPDRPHDASGPDRPHGTSRPDRPHGMGHPDRPPHGDPPTPNEQSNRHHPPHQTDEPRNQ